MSVEPVEINHFWRESTNWQLGLDRSLRLLNCFTCPLGCNPRGRICFRFRVFGRRREGPLLSWRRPARPESCVDPFQKACRVKKSRRLKQFGHSFQIFAYLWVQDADVTTRSGWASVPVQTNFWVPEGRTSTMAAIQQYMIVLGTTRCGHYITLKKNSSSVSPELLHWQEAMESFSFSDEINSITTEIPQKSSKLYFPSI